MDIHLLHFACFCGWSTYFSYFLTASVYVYWCVSLHVFSWEETASQQYGGRRQVGGVQRELFDWCVLGVEQSGRGGAFEDDEGMEAWWDSTAGGRQGS